MKNISGHSNKVCGARIFFFHWFHLRIIFVWNWGKVKTERINLFSCSIFWKLTHKKNLGSHFCFRVLKKLHFNPSRGRSGSVCIVSSQRSLVGAWMILSCSLVAIVTARWRDQRDAGSLVVSRVGSWSRGHGKSPFKKYFKDLLWIDF